MTRFTDSPYEYLMTQRPYAGKEADAGPPPIRRKAGVPDALMGVGSPA